MTRDILVYLPPSPLCHLVTLSRPPPLRVSRIIWMGPYSPSLLNLWLAWIQQYLNTVKLFLWRSSLTSSSTSWTWCKRRWKHLRETPRIDQASNVPAAIRISQISKLTSSLICTPVNSSKSVAQGSYKALAKLVLSTVLLKTIKIESYLSLSTRFSNRPWVWRNFSFRCTFCSSPVDEDESAGPKSDSRLLLAKFNTQMEKLYDLLHAVENIRYVNDFGPRLKKSFFISFKAAFVSWNLLVVEI